ncbi:aminopeptidase [Sporofaciens sp. SGI.106]|uniref:aminopeptidase n=1 Tax=Sporofaciens sp. SGI.106 TaxID=3420568 RepID=UPI003D02A1CF
MERKNLWSSYSEEQLMELEKVSEKYRTCLDMGKTERECVRTAIALAKEAGYRDMKELIRNGERVKPNDKVYLEYMERAIVLFQAGTLPIEQGMNILGAHIDSPRIDVKQNPLYESGDLAYLDTHYYGGVKKYQWLALPLALHGVVVRKDGTRTDISIGERDDEPALVITDLLPHLGRLQREKNADKFIDGEQMDLLIGNRPLKDEKEDGVKKQILRILKDRYNMEEEDFLSAEFEIVPAGKARDCGLDQSMVLAYGQDDRVCAFTSLFAMLEEKEVTRTSCCLLIDKEEIGSVGASGMTSRFFENAVAEYIALNTDYNDLILRRTLANSKMLSSDVSAGFDPMYEEVYEKKNAAYLARGPVFNKYTGSGGKSGSNDANPEYIAQLRKIMEDAGVSFQTAELGRVDIGGGGTIAYLMAVYGMEVIDSGVAVLSMHAPWEVTSKADIYETVRCYEAFLKAEF